jgi:hypothetical protein
MAFFMSAMDASTAWRRCSEGVLMQFLQWGCLFGVHSL